MDNLEWKYVSPLKVGTEVETAESKYHFRLPNDLRECLTEHNAGVPSLTALDLAEIKEWPSEACSPLTKVIWTTSTIMSLYLSAKMVKV